jgi:hypothetical protein
MRGIREAEYAPFVGTRRALIEQHKDEILAIARRHRGLAVAVFGSVARGDDDDESDVDFLVHFDQGSSLFDLMHLQDDLTELLGCRVDVVSVGGLQDRDEQIRREAISL